MYRRHLKIEPERHSEPQFQDIALSANTDHYSQALPQTRVPLPLGGSSLSRYQRDRRLQGSNSVNMIDDCLGGRVVRANEEVNAIHSNDATGLRTANGLFIADVALMVAQRPCVGV